MTREEAIAEIRKLWGLAHSAEDSVKDAATPIRNAYADRRSELIRKHREALHQLDSEEVRALLPTSTEVERIRAEAQAAVVGFEEIAAGCKVGDRVFVPVLSRYRGRSGAEREAEIVSVRNGNPRAVWINKDGKLSKGADKPWLQRGFRLKGD